MKRERREKLTKAEWQRITSRRPVVRRIANRITKPSGPKILARRLDERRDEA